jgi:DNA-binding response OmpR family regulator
MKDILIVEDGTPERERLMKLFSAEGYSVHGCESVKEAEEALRNEPYRLAILDIGLNDKSGSVLFGVIKRTGRVPFVVIFTGNPSVHLKQRFMEEGAVDYVVKGSPQAQSENFLNRVREILGAVQAAPVEGAPLEEFLLRHVTPASRKLFLDSDNSLPECAVCRAKNYVVTFLRRPQVPPELVGEVVCAGCGTPMDPKIS